MHLPTPASLDCLASFSYLHGICLPCSSLLLIIYNSFIKFKWFSSNLRNLLISLWRKLHDVKNASFQSWSLRLTMLREACHIIWLYVANVPSKVYSALNSPWYDIFTRIGFHATSTVPYYLAKSLSTKNKYISYMMNRKNQCSFRTLIGAWHNVTNKKMSYNIN